MIPLEKFVAWLAVGLRVLSIIFAALVQRENHTLTSTNAELARYVTTTLDSLEVEIAALRRSEDEIRDALESGGPREVLSVLRGADR